MHDNVRHLFCVRTSAPSYMKYRCRYYAQLCLMYDRAVFAQALILLLCWEDGA